MEDLEIRLRKLESQLAFYRGAVVVGTALLLAFLGFASFVEIPRAVKNAIDDHIGAQVLSRIKSLEQEYEKKGKALAALDFVRYGDPVVFAMPHYDDKLLSLSPPNAIRLNTTRVGTDETFVIRKP